MSMATYMCEPYESSVVNLDCSTTSVFAWNDFESSQSSIPCLDSPVPQPLPVSHSTPRRKGAFEHGVRQWVFRVVTIEYESPTAKRRVHLDMMLTTEFDLNTPQVSESSIAFNLLDTESDLSICSTSTYLQSTVSEKRSLQLSSTSQLSSASQLLSSVCCESRCLALLSLLEVEGCQKNFQSRSNIEQQQFLLDGISLMQLLKMTKCSFYLESSFVMWHLQRY